MGFPERILGDGEQVVLLLRPHVKVLLRPLLLLVVVLAAAVLLVARVPDNEAGPWLLGTIGLVAGAVLLQGVLWPVLVWRTKVYAVTTERLVIREGVLSRSGRDIPLARINDISFTHTLGERILGCGTLTVESAGERGQIVLVDVPRVETVQRTLYELGDALHTPDVPPSGPHGDAGGPHGERSW